MPSAGKKARASGQRPKADVLVVGGGRFGRLAVARLGGRVLAVAEPHPSAQLMAAGIPVIRRDGAAAAAELIQADRPPAWVVPALPRHFLTDWLKIVLPDFRFKTVAFPRAALPPVASLNKGSAGQYYLSLADSICPDDCPEPAGRCTLTGLPRKEPLFKMLAGLKVPGWRTVVLRSHQLAPGVGGIKTAEMKALARAIARKPGRLILATACRCHGVAQGLELAPKLEKE